MNARQEEIKNRPSRDDQRANTSTCLFISCREEKSSKEKVPKVPKCSQQCRLSFFQILHRLSSYGCQEAGRATQREGKTEALPEQDGCLGLLGFCVGRLDTEPVFINQFLTWGAPIILSALKRSTLGYYFHVHWILLKSSWKLKLIALFGVKSKPHAHFCPCTCTC